MHQIHGGVFKILWSPGSQSECLTETYTKTKTNESKVWKIEIEILRGMGRGGEQNGKEVMY